MTGRSTFTQEIERQMQLAGVPGLSAALVERDRVVWSEGFVADTMQSEIGEVLLRPQVEIDDSLAWGLGWGLAGDMFWHWGDMGFRDRDFQCVAVASRTEGRGLVCLTNSKHGLSACAEILREVLGDRFSYPSAPCSSVAGSDAGRFANGTRSVGRPLADRAP